jgi:hypothetical protein
MENHKNGRMSEEGGASTSVGNELQIERPQTNSQEVSLAQMMMLENCGPSGNILSVVHQKWRKLWKRDSAVITKNDPCSKVIYLGNVVTTWAKGEGCLEKPASALWRNHSQGRGSIKMTVTVTASGLKAQTREHGLTEYSPSRLTYCGVPPDYPKLFCWIYRHEGRKLKQELRCHAVLCSKEERAKCLALTLRNRLAEALYDFRKEKLLRQNARLSIVQSLYQNGAIKTRTRPVLLINSNSQNYKPPLERSKSAPKLSCIEEFDEEDLEESLCVSMVAEEDEEEEEEAYNETEHLAVGSESETNSNSLGDNELEISESPNDEEKEEEWSVSVQSRRVGSPDPHVDPMRNSCPETESPSSSCKDHDISSSKRPNSVPMDAKLNLPYLMGYDKVMHLLDISSESRDALLLQQQQQRDTIQRSNSCASDNSSVCSSNETPRSKSRSKSSVYQQEQEPFPAYPFVATNSDPVVESSPSSPAESVVTNSEDDSIGNKSESPCASPEEEDDNNDNETMSDESGYSEEGQNAVLINSRSNDSDDNLRKPSHQNAHDDEDSVSSKITGSSNPASPVSCSSAANCNNNNNSPSLVLYDNLCFEI